MGRYGSQEGYFELQRDRQHSAVVQGRTFTCQHCNKIVFVPPKADPADIGGLCKLCMGLICPVCVAAGGCDPLVAKIERAEEEGRMFAAIRGR